jgi:hypothetical protein
LSADSTSAPPDSSISTALELYHAFIRGSGWLPETPYERAPSREFCLPTSPSPAPTMPSDSSPSAPTISGSKTQASDEANHG